MLTAAAFRELLDAPLPALMEAAAARRDERFGTRITYSPKVFVPLTMLCRDRCGYCTFAKPPARLDAPYLTEEQVLELATRGGVEPGVAVAEVDRRIPHLQVEILLALGVVQIGAFAALENGRHIEIVDGVAEGAILGFKRAQAGFFAGG